MNKEKVVISKYISVIHRLSQSYYDQELIEYKIGCGQQFFLLRIYQEPGISMQELAKGGCYDKGTVTRAIQKLEELEYIRKVADHRDKRLTRLYIMDKAIPVINFIFTMLDEWHNILTSHLTNDEKVYADQLLKQLSDNAFCQMEYRKEEKNAAINSNKKEPFRI